MVSPCDAIVGACGAIAGTEVIQAKGFPYALQDLLIDPELVEHYRGGQYVTLRLTSSMYHRFHAPHDGARRARDLRLGRHLEHQPDRAQARRAPVLQERARGAAHAARAPATT